MQIIIKKLMYLILITPYRIYVSIHAKLFSTLYTTRVKFTCESYVSVKANAPTRVTRVTILGDNVNFNGMIITGGGGVNIGDNFHSGSECMIVTQNHNYESTKIPYDSSVTCKDVTIEDNVWMGNRVIVLPGVTIGEGAIIQAGAVVVRDVPKYSIAGGNPAKVFSQRNVEHYEKLKCQKMFH